jgi:hypothetical protein
MATVSGVLAAAASLLDRGVCRGANARLANGKACGVFDQRAVSHSMYGALCCVLGPGLGDEKALFASAAWKLISLRAWAILEEDERSRMEHALHDLNDVDITDYGRPYSHAKVFLGWATAPEIIALGEWH